MALNLSCGEYKTIRSFSGNPPVCDVCGWVYTGGSKLDTSPTVPAPDIGTSTSLQNLFCEKCNAVRPFFGIVPVCYECGWVYDPSPNPASNPARAAVKQTKSYFFWGLPEIVGRLFGWIILALVVYSILPASWTDPFLYSTVYQINSDQVHRDDKPTDCDFMHAPLGDKGCHYKKMVTAYNAAGNEVGGDNAPKYGTNAENNTIVTHDDGKTWQLLGASRPDSKVTKVEVYWVRVTE